MALKVTIQPHQTIAEVHQEHVVKAQAKAAKEEAKQQSINHVAEFKHADMANEDIVDTMPHPPFTPKLWQTSSSQKNTCLTSPTETSDFEKAEGFDTAKNDAEEIVPTSDEELPQDPKPKKVKVKVQDEINLVMKKIEENKVQNLYVNMLKSSKHAREDL